MRILIAEDELTSRVALKSMIEKCGHKVVATCNGAEAWEVMQQPDAPNLLVLDWMMPKMDGLEVCRRIRKQDAPIAPYIIILTARDDKADIISGLAAGANDYISKPYDPDELAARIGVGCKLVMMDATLAAERERLTATLASIYDGVIAVDTNRNVTLMNRMAEELTGSKGGCVTGTPFCEIFKAFDAFSREKTKCPVERAMHEDASWELADGTVLISSDGSEHFIDGICSPIRDSSGLTTGAVIAFRDVTERRQAESQIRLHSAAINAADDLIAILDRDGRVVFANTAFIRQAGYAPEDIVRCQLSALWPQSIENPPESDVWAAIRSVQAWNGEMQCRAKNGSLYAADVTLTPLPDEGVCPAHLIMIARNITERKEYEENLDYKAHHDALTNLPNRLFFFKELTLLLSDHSKKRKQCAVLFIDLDKFKEVNDTLGHQAGDTLLVETAARLASCLRDGDTLARMGGDEFTVLLKDIKSKEAAVTIAERMLRKVCKPFEISANKLVIGASIGIGIFPDDSKHADGLLHAADAAMYRAKELGRNNCQFFSEELNEANLAKLQLESDLRLAIERDEIKVYYQPIVDVRTMEIAGAEALLRWDHPEKGVISPSLFIPVAEQTGLILQMGKMALETACKQCKRWHDLGYTDFEMSVNVSPSQLSDFRFISEVDGVLCQADLLAHFLKLEVTETVLAKSDNDEVDVLSILKSLGVCICIDDFGVGYSSLGRLSNLPISHVKIDGYFTSQCDHNKKDRAMIESIIVMAHNLGIQVTAEWIEEEEQLTTIQSVGCDRAQGYLISPALPADAFEGFIQKWKLDYPYNVKRAS